MFGFTGSLKDTIAAASLSQRMELLCPKNTYTALSPYSGDSPWEPLELSLASSDFAMACEAFLELELLVEGNDIEMIMRKLDNGDSAPIVPMIGLSRGRHAPTIPSEDSTSGQYIVGVNRSGICQS